MDDRLYIVVWVNEVNETQGKGDRAMPLGEAKLWLKWAREHYPEIKHDIVEWKN